MKITKEEILQKQQQAAQGNSIGWLDTEKMNKFGIQTSQPLKLTGYEPKENSFRICQTQRPKW